MSDNRVKCSRCGFHYFQAPLGAGASKPGSCAVCKPPKAKKPKKQSKGQTKGPKKNKGK